MKHFEYEANHRYLQLSRFRDESAAATGVPGAPKKAARPVVEKYMAQCNDHLIISIEGAGPSCYD